MLVVTIVVTKVYIFLLLFSCYKRRYLKMYEFIQNMTKKKKFKGLPIQKLQQELQAIVNGEANNMKRHGNITVGTQTFQAAYETRVLNKYMNQTGPGDYRLLQQGNQFAVAIHTKQGGYQIMWK